MPQAFDYLFLTLNRAPRPHQALAEQLKAASGALAPAGGAVVGQFSPQLGWAGNEAAVLVRWSGERGSLGEARSHVPLIAGARHDRLTPTIRPLEAASIKAGGVHVHRWFEVETANVDEFVDLSGQGWARFETTFDALIYGLFRATPNERDLADGVTRLLLITRYGDHGVWEASRDPTTEAMQIFARRQQLTRRSWAASSLLAPPA